MKRMVLMLIAALALPLAAFASSNSVDFTNSGGTLSGSSSGLSLSGSTVVVVNGLNGFGIDTGANLGTVTFTTGALMSGSLQGQLGPGGTPDPTMFAGGGSFQITWNGGEGVPAGTIFNGQFTGPVSWTEVKLANGSVNYTLTGAIQGTWYNGETVNGAVVELTINMKSPFNGTTTISSGDINITPVPEPGTLGLLGTGLVGLAGVLKRKFKA
jgi:hypothetical protein